MKWLWHSFKAAPLANKLREVFGADTTFGSPKVRTLLMMVMRNATTDSPWPLSNNPYAKYNNAPDRPDDNLKFPLWQLVRASTAAPTYFPPEGDRVDEPRQDQGKGVRVRRRRRHHVQQPRLPDVPDGDARWLLAESAAQALEDRGGRHVDRIGGNGYDAKRSSRSRSPRHALAVQCTDHPVCPDVRRPERAGPALPGFRQVPGRRTARQGNRRPTG